MNPQIRQLFKLLLYMGKDYPAESGGYQKFSRSLKAAFRKTPVNSEEDLNKALQKGEYITKGTTITLLIPRRTNHRTRGTLLSTEVQTAQADILQ